MADLIVDYYPAVYAMAIMGCLMLAQLLIADFAGIKAKHPPGSAISADHGVFLFRAARTVANTNESIAIFVLAVLLCIFLSGGTAATNAFAWLYVASRLAYALCYYANLQTLRSTTFGISLIGILGLLITALLA